MMQYSIKQLQWEQTSETHFMTESPASNSFSKHLAYTFAEGKYWPVWDLTLPGYDTRQEVEAQGQLFHDAYIRDFISRYTC